MNGMDGGDKCGAMLLQIGKGAGNHHLRDVTRLVRIGCCHKDDAWRIYTKSFAAPFEETLATKTTFPVLIASRRATSGLVCG